MTYRAAALILAGAACIACAGCAQDPARGYSLQPTHAADVRTVGIAIFENQTFAHGVEAELTEAVVKEINRSTPWRVLTGPAAAEADTALTATVTTSSLRALSRGRNTGLVQEQAVQFTVDFDWRDNRSQTTLVSRRAFSATESFVPAQGTRERLEMGRQAAVQDLARAIVSELRSGW